MSERKPRIKVPKSTVKREDFLTEEEYQEELNKTKYQVFTQQYYDPGKEKYALTVQDFLDKGFDSLIDYRISCFNLKDQINSPEDLKQDILLHLFQTDYLARYNPETGRFRSYVYSIVDNFLKKRYNKENTRHGKFIVSAAGLDTSPRDDNDVFDGRVVYADLLQDDNLDQNFEFSVYLDNIREELKEAFTANSSFEDESGRIFERSPLTVFNLLIEDNSITSIASILGISKQYAFYLRSLVKNNPSLRELYRSTFGHEYSKRTISHRSTNNDQEEI